MATFCQGGVCRKIGYDGSGAVRARLQEEHEEYQRRADEALPKAGFSAGLRDSLRIVPAAMEALRHVPVLGQAANVVGKAFGAADGVVSLAERATGKRLGNAPLKGGRLVAGKLPASKSKATMPPRRAPARYADDEDDWAYEPRRRAPAKRAPEPKRAPPKRAEPKRAPPKRAEPKRRVRYEDEEDDWSPPPRKQKQQQRERSWRDWLEEAASYARPVRDIAEAAGGTYREARRMWRGDDDDDYDYDRRGGGLGRTHKAADMAAELMERASRRRIGGGLRAGRLRVGGLMSGGNLLRAGGLRVGGSRFGGRAEVRDMKFRKQLDVDKHGNATERMVPHCDCPPGKADCRCVRRRAKAPASDLRVQRGKLLRDFMTSTGMTFIQATRSAQFKAEWARWKEDNGREPRANSRPPKKHLRAPVKKRRPQSKREQASSGRRLVFEDDDDGDGMGDE
jgi:hypothetical protein